MSASQVRSTVSSADAACRFSVRHGRAGCAALLIATTVATTGCPIDLGRSQLDDLTLIEGQSATVDADFTASLGELVRAPELGFDETVLNVSTSQAAPGVWRVSIAGLKPGVTQLLVEGRTYPSPLNPNFSFYVYSIEVTVMGDKDRDGVSDSDDNCPASPNVDQSDRDGDETGDACDGCPDDPLKIEPGALGCGNAEADSDADGIPDSTDRCAGANDRLDTDGDGAPDCLDGCPQDANKTAPGACGCGQPESDTDADGVPDCIDNCPLSPNPDQADADTDGTGNACEATTPTFVDREMSLWGVNGFTETGELEWVWPVQSSDGLGNADPYLRLEITAASGAVLDMVVQNAGFSLPWSPPGRNGVELDHLDLAMDRRVILSTLPNAGYEGGFVLIQGGVTYRTSARIIGAETWETDARPGLRREDFADALGRNPDFAADAPIIGFGYFRRLIVSDENASEIQLIEGVDNYSITAVTR